jgi:hypothetical protein
MTQSFPRFPRPVEALTARAAAAADFTAATALDPEQLAPLVGLTVVAKVFPGGNPEVPAHTATGILEALYRAPDGTGTIALAGAAQIPFTSYDAITLFHP